MNSTSAWDRLPTKEKMSLCLDQVEQIIFRATMIGLVADSRSLDAVAKAKKILHGDVGKKMLPQDVLFIREALDVVREEVEMGFQPRHDLNKRSLAHVCFRVAYDICLKYATKTMEDNFPLATVVSEYVLSVGEVEERSVLADWIRDNSTSETRVKML